jgi:glutaredoxin 3
MKIVKQPQRITLYSRPMCSWCEEAKAWLNERGWPFESRNTGSDPAARQRAIELSGQSCVPVIEVDGLVLGDFDTGQLETFLKQHGYLA